MPKKITIAQLFKEEWEKCDALPSIFCSGRPIPPLPEQPRQGRKHWVETYSPSLRKGYTYYRYVWVDNGQLRHRHIIGGNVGSKCALALKERVESAIASGLSPQEIEQLIKSR